MFTLFARHIRPTLLSLAAFAAILAHAENVKLLTTDEARMAAHFDVIDHAKIEVDAAMAYLHDDAIGRAFLARLVKAAERHVKVRLILDGVNSHLTEDTIAFLKANGVEVRYFHLVNTNPRTWTSKVSWLWQRMHDKLVVADAWRTVTGTENIGVPYYKTLVDDPHKGFIGRNLLIEGNSAAEGQGYFAAMWDSPDVRPPTSTVELTPDRFMRQNQLLEEAAVKVDATLAAHISAPTAGFSINEKDIQFLSKLDDERGTANGLRHKIIEMIKSANTRVVIETPYLNPDPEITELLAAKAHKGIPVTIYTNSPISNNHPTGNALYQGEAKRLRALGIDVKEWQGADTIHGKTFLVDDNQVIVTTYNLNLRSIRVDTESGVYMKSVDAVKAVETDLKVSGYATPARSAGSLMNQCLRALFRRIALDPFKDQW